MRWTRESIWDNLVISKTNVYNSNIPLVTVKMSEYDLKHLNFCKTGIVCYEVCSVNSFLPQRNMLGARDKLVHGIFHNSVCPACNRQLASILGLLCDNIITSCGLSGPQRKLSSVAPSMGLLSLQRFRRLFVSKRHQTMLWRHKVRCTQLFWPTTRIYIVSY